MSWHERFMCQPAALPEHIIGWVEEGIDEPELGNIDQTRRHVPEKHPDGVRIGNGSSHPQHGPFARTMPGWIILMNVPLNARDDPLEKRMSWCGDDVPLLKFSGIRRFCMDAPSFEGPAARIVPMRQQIVVIWLEGLVEGQGCR